MTTKKGDGFLNAIRVFLFLFVENLQRLGHIIKKDFKILIRSKVSALVIIFGPLLIILLIGIAFNTSSIYDVHVGVYSDKYSELSEKIISGLRDDNYLIKKVNSTDRCIEGVKAGELNICLVMSSDITVENNKTNKIYFYADYSRVNLVYAIMDNIGSKLSKETNKLSLNLTQSLVNEIEMTKKEFENKATLIANMLSSNRALYNNIVNTTTTLNNTNISTDISSLGFDAVEDDFDRLYDYFLDHNLSFKLSGMDDLNASLDDLHDNLVNYTQNTRTVEASLKSTLKGMEGMKSDLDTDKARMEGLKASIEKVTQGIASIKVMSAENIVTPIDTEVVPVVTEDKHVVKLLPTFLTLVIMFVCIMLGSTLVMNEKTTNAHFRNFITPTHDGIFLLGTYLTSLIIVFIQTAIIFLVVAFFLTSSMAAGLLLALYPLFLIASLFILIGIIIGYLFNSHETSTLASLFIVSCSLVLSNTILPLESVPGYLKQILMYNPFVLSETAFRSVIIFGFGLDAIADVTHSIWYALVVFIILAYLAMKLYKKKMHK